MAANLADPVRLTSTQMTAIDDLHLEPGKHGRVNSEAWDAASATVFGWSLERMGWSVGYPDSLGKRSVAADEYVSAVKHAAAAGTA
jgi:hypothetical protein